MRRKSERTAATKKSKTSPEKKVEKAKRTRSSRRKKHSTSSENDSADDASPPREAEPIAENEATVPPKTPVKEESPEEQQDQIWRVKAAEGTGDTGEIQKLKICLTRPPSTPERAERSPRSKRKQSRATSSSDTPSVDAPEERRKSKHRAKRSHRESKDGSEKTQDSQDDETESDAKSNQDQEKTITEATQSESEEKVDSSENTISTSSQETKNDDKATVDSTEDSSKPDEGKTEKEDKASDADTTVVSPEAETTVVSAPSEPIVPSKSDNQEAQDETTLEPESPTRRRSASVDKSEILELHPEDSKVDSDIEGEKSKKKSKDLSSEDSKDVEKVSNSKDKTVEEPHSDNDPTTNNTGVVESSISEKTTRKLSSNAEKEQDESKTVEKSNYEGDKHKSIERSESIQSNPDEPHLTGQAAPIVVSRKRRWGSRPAKVTKQKSLTISTDVLKEIIPDVKPVEFEEVIEEKKHKRVVTEKIERPILPKIIIDNSENVHRAEQERHADKKEHDNKDMAKVKDMAANRKISIIKDNESIITRPPSPPRHKQSCILYITNLVRPFTLLQLKNLLQRTGKIVENGFWIDKIKSKCFVIYESEDQAVETRHALHGVTWPVSNPKSLQVDFSTQEAFDKAKLNEDTDNAQMSTIPGTVEDWLREQDMKRERGEVEKLWERKAAMREWDLGKNEKTIKEKEGLRRDERPQLDKRRHRTPERSPEPARKFKKKEEEAPAKLLDDLFKKTKTTPCIYWLPLSAETIAIKEEQRRQHMAEHERRMQEQRRTHRRH